MKSPALVVLAFVLACQPAVSGPEPTPAFAADVALLASPALAGREAGSPEAYTAAQYIARRYAELGLQPAFGLRCSTPPCAGSYFQGFGVERGVAHNVSAIIDGADSVARSQFVVVGAHFDHIGRSPAHALDGLLGYRIRPGADDNASGTAGVLELARRLRARPTRRSILIVNFDAEELGLVGSRVFLDDLPVARQTMTFMLNLDMIGRLRDNRIFIEGVRERVIRTIIDSALVVRGVRGSYHPNGGRSDHSTFLDAGIEAIMLTTGEHMDYHRATDIVERIDFRGMQRVVDVAEFIIRHIADR